MSGEKYFDTCVSEALLLQCAPSEFSQTLKKTLLHNLLKAAILFVACTPFFYYHIFPSTQLPMSCSMTSQPL